MWIEHYQWHIVKRLPTRSTISARIHIEKKTRHQYSLFVLRCMYFKRRHFRTTVKIKQISPQKCLKITFFKTWMNMNNHLQSITWVTFFSSDMVSYWRIKPKQISSTIIWSASPNNSSVEAKLDDAQQLLLMKIHSSLII